MISRCPLLITVVALAVAPAVFGQETSAPAVPSGGVVAPDVAPAGPKLHAPGALPSSDNRAPAPDAPLMPDQTPSIVKPEPDAGTAEKKPATKTSKTEAFEQTVAQKIRYRQVHTMALADPALQAQWNKSLLARTEVEKRTILKEYYKQFFARMTKIDPSIKTLIDIQALNADHRITQIHITPTEVFDDGERSTSARVFSD